VLLLALGHVVPLGLGFLHVDADARLLLRYGYRFLFRHAIIHDNSMHNVKVQLRIA